MAEPSYWVPVLTPDIWNPLANPLDWEEVAAEQGTEPGGSWARDDASVTLIGDIPYNKRYDARRKILGYAYPDTSSPWALHRVNPLPHPDERMLRAVACDIAGWNPQGVTQPTSGFKAGYPAPYLDPPPAAGTILLPRIATYSRARCTIKFRPHNYPFVEDATMVAEGWPEVFRNTAFFDSCDPILDVLLTDSAPFLKWGEGPKSGQTIASQTPDYIQRASLVAIWYHVPETFIVSGGDYIPSKIFDGIGKVNATDWYGFPAGTLRLEAPRFRRALQAPIRVDPTSYFLPFVYDIVFPFSYVNPTAAEASPIYRGWNLYPDGPTGKWYSVKRANGSPDPQPYFEFYDFDLLFEHVDKP